MNEHEVFEVVRDKTVEVLPEVAPAEVSIDGSLVDLGANSIDRVDIVTLSMEELGVTIPPTEFADVKDLRSLVTLLERYA